MLTYFLEINTENYLFGGGGGYIFAVIPALDFNSMVNHLLYYRLCNTAAILDDLSKMNRFERLNFFQSNLKDQSIHFIKQGYKYDKGK